MQQVRTRGFTLLEMIVAVGVFTVVMLIAVSALLATVDAHRKAGTLQVVVQNLEFALDSVARGIRTGTTYHCGGGSYDVPLDCTNTPASTLAFEKNDGNPGIATDQVVYRLQNSRIERSINGGSSFSPITAPEVVIDTLDFFVFGAPAGDTNQPHVLMKVSGRAGVHTRTESSFTVQTTITQRELDS